MNYDSDGYINYGKEQNVIEGNPQPTQGSLHPYGEHGKRNDMKAAKRSLMSRGHKGSKEHPRG